MSEFDDDSPFDQDDLEAAGLTEPSQNLTPEEIFSMVMINKKKGVQTRIELRDEKGDVVQLHEIVSDLLEYLKDKLASDEDNQVGDQIFPMMAHAMVSGLGRMVGIPLTGFFISSDMMRTSMIQMMCISFLLLKYVQTHKLTIVAIEEPLQQEEIESLERKARANSVATLGALTGLSYKEILKELVDKGELTQEDLAEMLSKDKSNDPGKLQ